MSRRFEEGKPRWLHSDMGWDDRLYYLRDSWNGACCLWRYFICRRIVIPLSRWICGPDWPISRILHHLDDLEDSVMYGGLCYELPDHILVEDRVQVGRMTLGWVRTYIKHNYFGEESDE